MYTIRIDGKVPVLKSELIKAIKANNTARITLCPRGPGLAFRLNSQTGTFKVMGTTRRWDAVLKVSAEGVKVL